MGDFFLILLQYASTLKPNSEVCMKHLMILISMLMSISAFSFESRFASTSIQEIKTIKDGYRRFRYIKWNENIYPKVAIEAIENGSEGEEDIVHISVNVLKELSKKYNDDFVYLQYNKDAVSGFTYKNKKAHLKLKIVGHRVGELSCRVVFDARKYDTDCYYE